MKKAINKTVLITGATSGIGKAMAKKFAKHGFNLILTGRRHNKLKEIKSLLSEKYAIDVLTLNFDVTDKKQVAKAIKGLSKPWDKIDILINNAGLALGVERVFDADVEDWDIMIDTNIKGILYMTRLIAPKMIKNGDGHIINICSTAGHEVYKGGSVYCATKHAVDALTKSMRLELFDKGIRVGQVSPGAVEETEFSIVRYKGDKAKANIYSDFNPLRSSDVAYVVYFIATQAKHINIQDVLMTGTQQAGATEFDKSGRKYD